MDYKTKDVYWWLRGNLTRPRMSNSAIRNELHVNAKYIRRAKAVIRSEEALVAQQKQRSVSIERIAASLRAAGIRTDTLTDFEILHLASLR